MDLHRQNKRFPILPVPHLGAVSHPVLDQNRFEIVLIDKVGLNPLGIFPSALLYLLWVIFLPFPSSCVDLFSVPKIRPMLSLLLLLRVAVGHLSSKIMRPGCHWLLGSGFALSQESPPMPVRYSDPTRWTALPDLPAAYSPPRSPEPLGGPARLQIHNDG